MKQCEKSPELMPKLFTFEVTIPCVCTPNSFGDFLHYFISLYRRNGLRLRNLSTAFDFTNKSQVPFSPNFFGRCINL
eukprot:UN00398